MDRAAKQVGVNFIGGYSALVHKGTTPSDQILIQSIPEALSVTDNVCSSINVGSTKTGINMDAVRDIGAMIKKTAFLYERIETRLVVQNSLSFVMHQMIIHLWQELFTVSVKRIRL